MKTVVRIARPVVLLLVSFALLSGCDRQGPSSPTPPAGVAPAAPPAGASSASVDQRLSQLEQDFHQLQEQNKQLLQAIKDKATTGPQSSETASASVPTPQANPAPGPESGARSSPQPVPETDADQTKLVHGWIARIMPVGADGRVVPSDELGHFVATKDSYKLRDFTKEAGIRSGADVGWKGDAFLEVTERGRHTVSINLTRAPNSGIDPVWCWASLGLEGQSIAEGQIVLEGDDFGGPDEVKSVVGGADLVPGRYRVEFWVACGGPSPERFVTTTGGNGYYTAEAVNVAFEVMVKSPSDSVSVSAAKAFVIKEVAPPTRKGAALQRRAR